jgi:hypothetical protein
MRLLGSVLCCVLATGARAQWYGGYGFPSSSTTNVIVVYPPRPQPPSVVVIDRARRVSAPAERQEEYAPAQQTTYLIAFKNHVIRVADQYWVKGKTLIYLTTDHQRWTAPLDSVDRTLSKRLNSEQNVAFYLPAGEGRAVVRARLVRHTATVVHKRCYCVHTRSTGDSSPGKRRT